MKRLLLVLVAATTVLAGCDQSPKLDGNVGNVSTTRSRPVSVSNLMAVPRDPLLHTNPASTSNAVAAPTVLDSTSPPGCSAYVSGGRVVATCTAFQGWKMRAVGSCNGWYNITSAWVRIGWATRVVSDWCAFPIYRAHAEVSP